MIKTNANDSRMTLDNSQLNLIRKDSNNSWYKYSEEDGSLTPVSCHDDMPLTLLDSKAKFKTFRKINGKSLLDTENSVKENTGDEASKPTSKRKKLSIEAQDRNDVSKCEEIDIEFKESDSSSSKIIQSKSQLDKRTLKLRYYDDIEESGEGCIRMLHKMIGNTVKHYKIEEKYDADKIMKMFEQNHLLQKYSKLATLDQDMRMLSSIIDFGEKPIHFALNPSCVEMKLDGVKLTKDGILIPKKRPISAARSENQSESSSKSASIDEDKLKRYKSMLSYPPRPNEKLDVLIYGE